MESSGLRDLCKFKVGDHNSSKNDRVDRLACREKEVRGSVLME